MPYPKRVWVRLDRPEGEVNLRDKVGRDIGDIPEGIELTVTGIDAQGRYIVEAYIASSVCQDTDPNAPAVLNWAWPTEYKVVTQNWGARPEYYQQFGLPGHDGKDIRAYIGSKLFAVWDGIVTRLDTNPATWGAYGYSIRVRYEWQGDTHEVIYAHGQAGSAKVKVGDRVTRGQHIMNAGNTGNVQGAHLHLGLKVIGKTYTDIGPNGLVRVWPNNLHDPTPYLFPETTPPPQYATLDEGHALKGVHSPADPGAWAYTQPVLNAIERTHMDAVFVLCPEADPATIDKIRAQGVSFIAARLFAHMGERRGDTIEQRANWFIAEVKQSAIALYAKGIRYYQLHNEPNLLIEGLGSNWNNGIEFAQFFSYVVSILKLDMPLAKFGFPGLSPGGTIPGVRQDSAVFFSQAQQAVNQSDWLGLHQYFGNEGVTYGSAVQSIAKFCNEHRDKVVLLTEFSNSNREVAKAIKGQEYKAFYVALKTQTPPNLGAAFAFVVSSTSGFEHETFVEKDGTHSAIVHALS